MRKLLSPAERAVIRKDAGEVWAPGMTRMTMLIIPLMMALIFPLLFLLILYNVPMDQVNGVDRMLRMLPAEAKSYSVRQGMFYFLTNMICPMLFLMIPLMTATVSAANSFVGEKERGTLETLLLTPLTVGRIFRAKVLGCVFLSAAVTGISFLAFSVVISAGDILLQMPFFLNWNWLILIFLLAPGITVFGVVFMVAVSAKSKSYIEAYQTSGYLVLPILLLFIGPLTGLFTLSAFLLLLVSAAVLAADVPVWLVARRLFSPEKLSRS